MGFKFAKWKITWVQKGNLPNVKRMMPTLMGVAADLARNEWIKVARANLRTSKEYKNQKCREKMLLSNWWDGCLML
jgi:hypothetical protein